MFRPSTKQITNERGATVPLVAVCLVALLSVCALAVDLGMLLTGRSEAQRTADSAALAGASAFIDLKDPIAAQDAAWSRAKQYSLANPIRSIPMAGGAPVVSETSTAYVYTTPDLTVSIFKSGDRVGALTRRNPLMLWFAQVFGKSTAAVSAYSEARVVNGSMTNCLKPLLVADRWNDNGDAIWGSGDSYDRTMDGWSVDQYGHQLDLKYLDQEWNNNSTLKMNSFLPFRFPGTQGGKDLLEAIKRRGCGYDQSVGVGDPVVREPGLTWGQFEKAWKDLIAADRADNGDMYYDGVTGKFHRETSPGSGVYEITNDWSSSYRIVPIAFFDPSKLLCTSSTGKTVYCDPLQTSGFIRVFAEETFFSGNDKGLRVRVIGPVPGGIGDCEAKGTCSPDIKALRLVN